MKIPERWRNSLQAALYILIGMVILVAAFILWRWYEAGGGFEVLYVVIGIVLAGLWGLKHRLVKQQPPPPPTTISSSSPPPAFSPTIATFALVRQQMNDVFTLDEIRSLTYDLGINYDNLAGQTLDSKIISLLIYTTQHNQRPALQTKLTELRPHVRWDFPNQSSIFNFSTDRNRANFLNTFKTTWIDGFLHQSLHNEVIKLTMTKANKGMLIRDARQRSWQMVKQQAGYADELVALDKPVSEVFNECGRGLLILGDPGSGKTITLLQLAEDLLTEVAFPDKPMPVVLNLSSWAQEKLALTDWLVDEIFVQYSVGRNLARQWIESNNFVYLLDGLDEVAADARNACVTAINEFRAVQRGVVEMVVCSRTTDYEALSQRLNLSVAIQIQPLSDEQVDIYLRQPGLDMEAVRCMLQTDLSLRELTRSPLMLNVMVLAYQDKMATDLQIFNNVDDRRQHLFDTYIDTMFTRPPLPAASLYSEADARHWLMEIAYGLTEHNASEFYIEKLQPNWLPPGKPRRINRLINRLIIGLSVGLIFGLSIGLIFIFFDRFIDALIIGIGGDPVIELSNGLFSVLLSGLILGLIFGLIGGLNDGRSSGLSAALSGGLIGGLIGGWVVEQNARPIVEQINGVNIPLIGGLIVGMGVGLSAALSVVLIGSMVNSLTKNDNHISTVEELHWHRPSFYKFLMSIKNGSKSGYGAGQGVGLVGGLIGGLVLGLNLGLSIGLNTGLKAEWNAESGSVFGVVNIGISVGILGMAFYSLIGLLSGAVIGGADACFMLQETRQKTKPNQGVRSSFRNLWRMGLLYSALLGGLGALFSFSIYWLLIGLMEFVLMSIGLFMLYGVWNSFVKYGGVTVIRHYVLRWVLARYNILPFPLSDKKMVAFLDSMVERILLRRTGNGYIFIHRSLMEHFAAKHLSQADN